MCPDPQLLSIYVDCELPSPWNEKMDAHLKDCPECRGKFENFSKLHQLFNKDAFAIKTNETEIQTSKERIWHNIEANHRFMPRPSKVWRRRISISIPAAAAAAIIIALITVFISGGGQIINNRFASNKTNPDARSNIILAAEEEIPGIIPAATDLNGVLQYLGADGSDIIILRLPESRNFSRAGEPAIIRAADYSRRHP